MAIFKCGGRYRLDGNGKPYCTYESEEGWTGRCPGCRLPFDVHKIGADKRAADNAEEFSLSHKGPPKPPVPRFSTQIPWLDQALGGGLIKGSLVIISGPPGTGKTTLLLQAGAGIVRETDRPVLYISGEQGRDRVVGNAERVGVGEAKLYIIGKEHDGADMHQVIAYAERYRPGVIVVDSLGTAFVPTCGGEPGKTSQCIAVTQYLLDYCTREKVSCIIVAHVNKDGELAGPEAAAHLVDTVLELDPAERRDEDNEVVPETKDIIKLRVEKNRDGGKGLEFYFKMTATGLVQAEKPVLKKKRRDDEDEDAGDSKRDRKVVDFVALRREREREKVTEKDESTP